MCVNLRLVHDLCWLQPELKGISKRDPLLKTFSEFKKECKWMQETDSSNRSHWHFLTSPRTNKQPPFFFLYIPPTDPWSDHVLSWPCWIWDFQGSLFEHFWPVCRFPSHSLWPHAPGREGEALGWGFLRSGAHAPGGGWLKGPGQASLWELSEELPPDQSQGQGHPLRENQWQCCEFAFLYRKLQIALQICNTIFVMIKDDWGLCD